eukprot:180726_1
MCYDFIWKIPFIEPVKLKLFLCGYLKQNIDTKSCKSILCDENIIDVFYNYLNQQSLLNNIQNAQPQQKFFSDIFCVNLGSYNSSFKFVIVLYSNGISRETEEKSYISIQSLSNVQGQKQLQDINAEICLLETSEIIHPKFNFRYETQNYHSSWKKNALLINNSIQQLKSITLGINIYGSKASQSRNTNYMTKTNHDHNQSFGIYFR